MHRRFSFVLAVAAMFLAAPAPIAEAGGSTQRPIEDWLSEQGQGFGLALGFAADYLAWTGRDAGNPNTDIDKIAFIDFAGIDAAAVEAESGGSVVIDTKISGSVTEKTLKDGRTEVHVRLHAQDALTYVHDANSAEVIFGADPGSVAEGSEPALGDASMRLVYVVDRPIGGTMEDIMEVIFFGTGDINWASFHAVASGQLGDGADGMVTVSETGPIMAAIKNGFKGGLADAFPVENVTLREIGN